MIIKIKPDIEKAKSMFKLILNRETSLVFLKKGNFSTVVAETYYEIIKEICNLILLMKGFKSVGENSHKDLFSFLFSKKIFTEEEFRLIDELRFRRNGSSYYGKEIKQIYLDNKEKDLMQMIKKLKKLFNSIRRE
jgi:protein associated with RNAse G/E